MIEKKLWRYGKVTDFDKNRNVTSGDDYGTSPDNPICLRCVQEEYIYLDFLRCENPKEIIVIKRRDGSFEHNGAMLDKWILAVVRLGEPGVREVVLYINAYAKARDYGKAPQGLVSTLY